jgi:hypothetical protein
MTLAIGGEARWVEAQEVWASERRWKETPTVPAVVPARMFFGDRGDVYQNYAFTGYRNYDSLTGRPPWSNIYDQLGNFLISGRQLATWTGEQSQEGDIRNGDSVLQSNLANFHGVLSMGGQTYSGWASNLIFSRGSGSGGVFWTKGITTRFTPLTLNRVSLQGVRADILSPFGDALSLVASYQYAGYTGGEDFHGGGDDSAILLAGHYERETGPLRLGATVANLHMFDARYPTTDLRGDLHATQPIPALIAVRISDDSPTDGQGGPVVYGVQLVINGQVRPNLLPDLVRRDLTNTFTVVGRTSSLTGNFRPSFYYEPVGRSPGPYFGLEKPLYADYLYRRDHEANLQDRDTSNDEDVAEFADVDRLVRFIGWEDPTQVQRANGTEALVYYFSLEGLTHVRSVEVEASVGNDYRIEVADISVTNPNDDKYDSRYSAPFYKIVRRAEGNVQDLSNVERLRIPISNETGQSVWGVNMALDLVGLKVRGEFAQSITYSRYRDGVPGDELLFRGEYPVLYVEGVEGGANGERYRDQDRAGYLQLERETARYGFGGELFSTGPRFNQRLVQRPGEVGIGGGEPYLKNKTTFFSMLEDNDDGDANPEGNIRGSAPRDLSVFPGQDEDNDGIPDTNRNLNGLPDYLEPFLLYQVDPDEYVYGLDFNNNDVVDKREDDQKQDLPYDRDLRGGHAYVRWKPWEGAGATAGWLQSHEIAGGGRNDQRYLRLQYSGERPGVGEWQFENEVKRVWDDVPDDVYSWTAENASVDQRFLRADEGRLAYFPTFTFDPLNYRNSLANRLYVSGTMKWLPGWRIVTRLKLEHNRQYGGSLGDGSEQIADRIRSLAWVQQADYTWRWGKLTLQPALKGRWLKRTRQQAERALDHTQTIVPIVMASYKLSPVTDLKAGFQGVPGWWFEETDLAEPRDSFKRRTTMVFLSNMSDYSGYKISTNLGFKQDKLQYKDEFRFLESFDTTEIFVRLYLGYAQSVLF